MEKRMMEVINACDKSKDKDVIIRYLIVNLAPFFRRDLNFYLRDEKEQAKMLNRGVSYKDDGNIICLTLSEFYVDLFKHFGISAEVVKATRGVIPLYGVIVEGTNCKYFIDTLTDLMPSQYGIVNNFYGTLPNWKTSILQLEHPELSSLTLDYIHYLDRMINRFPGDSTDSILLGFSQDELSLSRIKEYLKEDRINNLDSIDYKMQFMSEHCINLGKVDEIIERHKMYGHLFRVFFQKYERGLIRQHIFRSYDDTGNPTNPVLTIIVNNMQNNAPHAIYEEVKAQEGKYVLIRKR